MPEVKKETGIQPKKKKKYSSSLIISYSLYYKQTEIKLIFGKMWSEEATWNFEFQDGK